MSIAAEPRPRAAQARARAGRALTWWLGELAALHRDAARALGAGERGAVTLEAGERYWTLRHRQQVIGQIDRAVLDGGAATQALADAVPPGLRGRAVIVEIPPERLLSKTVTFPAGARAELDRIVDFEIARHFPFPVARVFYRHRVLRHAAGSGVGPIAVEVVAVPREVVAAIRADLAAAGLHVAAVALLDGSGAEKLWLPPEAVGAAGAAPPRAASPVLLAVIGVLSLTAAVSWPLAQHWRLAALDHQIAALRPHAETILERRRLVEDETARVAAMVKLKAARPPLVGVLDTLSNALPDGAWLLSLSVSGRELIIDGLAPSAATVALALQKSGAFSAIDFRAPITRESAGLEDFQIGATIGSAAGVAAK